MIIIAATHCVGTRVNKSANIGKNSLQPLLLHAIRTIAIFDLLAKRFKLGKDRGAWTIQFKDVLYFSSLGAIPTHQGRNDPGELLRRDQRPRILSDLIHTVCIATKNLRR